MVNSDKLLMGIKEYLKTNWNWLFYFVVVPLYIGLIVIFFSMGNIAMDLVAGGLIILGMVCFAGAITDLVVWLKDTEEYKRWQEGLK